MEKTANKRRNKRKVLIMKKIVFAMMLSLTSAPAFAWSVDLPNLWWPDAFSGDKLQEEKPVEKQK